MSIYRIQDLSEDDRPREKALKHGLQSLSDTELMAIILSTGVHGKSVIELSQEILNRHGGSLTDLCRLSIHEVSNGIKGMGPAKAISLMAAIELGTRCCRALDMHDPERISGSQSAYAIMRQRLERERVEQFWVIFLARNNTVIATECISRGGTASTVVDSKVIFKSAIEKLANGIILVHNHPSGNTSPSIQDDQLTDRIAKGAKLLDLRLVDHLIITPSSYYSYADSGRL